MGDLWDRSPENAPHSLHLHKVWLARDADYKTGTLIKIVKSKVNRVAVRNTEPAAESAESDRRFVEDFLAGSEEAFNRLVLKYQHKAYNAALRVLGNHEDAIEVAQEAFLRVYKNVKKFRWNCSFQTWLYTIVLNLARSRYRKNKRRGQYVKVFLDNPLRYSDGEETTMEIADERLSPERQAERGEVRRQIQAGLDALKPELREIMVLRHVEDLSYEQIAEILKIAEGTVKSRLHRARQELQKLLKGLL